jgi:hypothetical protein
VLLSDGSVYSVDSGDQPTVSGWTSGDEVKVAESGDAITDLSTGDQVTVTSVGGSSDRNVYPGIGDHSLMSNSDDGTIVVLDDGSIWIVAAGDTATSSVWVDATAITANEGSSAPQAYDLVNTDDQEAVAASYVGKE